MELTEKIQVCNSLEEIPEFKTIKSIPKGQRFKIVFGDKIKPFREKIGRQWNFEHPEFQIGVHTIEPEINIVKLISENEIEEHQEFLEKCAKDYRSLATQLIQDFAQKNRLEIDPDYTMNTLNSSGNHGYKQVGKMGDWRYYFHGIHWGFTNLKTEQNIEVPLTFGLEFGELDPYFFTGFIKSTKDYHPLPIVIFCDYDDGKRILKKMVELGKFEYINSNWPNEKGIVVTDRKKLKSQYMIQKVKKKKKDYVESLLASGQKVRNETIYSMNLCLG